MSILQIQAQHISSVFSLPTIALWKLFINPFKVLFFCFFFTSLGLLFSFTPFDFIKKKHNAQRILCLQIKEYQYRVTMFI